MGFQFEHWLMWQAKQLSAGLGFSFTQALENKVRITIDHGSSSTKVSYLKLRAMGCAPHPFILYVNEVLSKIMRIRYMKVTLDKTSWTYCRKQIGVSELC